MVSAGFGLWRDGKCLAAGKWTDIAGLRAYRRDVPPNAICVIVQLRDGSEVEMQQEAPGWASFMNAAASKLPGTPPTSEWISDVQVGDEERILFARS